LDNIIIYDVKHLENSWVLLNNSVKARYDVQKGLQVQYNKVEVSPETAVKVVRKYFSEIFTLG